MGCRTMGNNTVFDSLVESRFQFKKIAAFSAFREAGVTFRSGVFLQVFLKYGHKFFIDRFKGGIFSGIGDQVF